MSVCASRTNEWTVRCAYLICIPLLREPVPPYKRAVHGAHASHLHYSFTDCVCEIWHFLILCVSCTSGCHFSCWRKVQVNMNALCVSIFDLCLCVHFWTWSVCLSCFGLADLNLCGECGRVFSVQLIEWVMSCLGCIFVLVCWCVDVPFGRACILFLVTFCKELIWIRWIQYFGRVI